MDGVRRPARQSTEVLSTKKTVVVYQFERVEVAVAKAKPEVGIAALFFRLMKSVGSSFIWGVE